MNTKLKFIHFCTCLRNGDVSTIHIPEGQSYNYLKEKFDNYIITNDEGTILDSKNMITIRERFC